MSTKNNPGAFRCYEAALPDEHIFTILARDPAGPATLRFWADERERLGKTEDPDDVDRIDDARRDAELMEDWRAANLDPVGTGPTWRGVTVNDELGGPIRVEPDNTVYIYAERDGDDAVRMNIEWLKARTRDMVEGRVSRKLFGTLIEHACQAPDRPRERVVPVEEAAFDAAKRDARTLTMMNAMQNAIRMLDDLGAIPGYALSVNAIRETLFNGLAEAPVVETTESEGFYAKVRRLLELTKDEVWAGELACLWQELWRYRPQTPGEQVVVDSQPTDLAHAPEVPPHRFSVFHKGEKYAYARGLEINPTHLPTALDAMEKDGWSLVAIFGQTDSPHVGFIFRRAYTGGTVKSDYREYDGIRVRGPSIPAILPDGEIIHPRQGGISSQKHRRFMQGDPLDEIRADGPPVAEPERERFVIEYVERLPDGTGCCATRVAAHEWPEWAQPCSDRGRGMMP